MKKIVLLFFIFALSLTSVNAKGSKDYTVKFNGTKYHLLYSVKNKDFGGYLNEYYKKGETYNIWTELVAVHHFPNAYSPIDRIREFKDYLGSMGVPSSLTFDDKKNTAMIDFIMISEKQMPIVLEFNVFKYQKSKKCGTVGIQYAKRYAATTTMQIEEIKKEFEQDRKKVIAKVKKFKVPEVITTDIDKCMSASDIIEQNKQEELAEEKEKQVIAEEKNDAVPEVAEVNSAKEEQEKIAEEASSDENVIEIEDQESTEEAKNTDTTKETKDIEESNETEDVELVNEDITKAPTPDIAESKNDIEEPSDEEKNVKNVSYLYVNSKDKYIATPRTKKELKREVKQKKKAQKEAIKQKKKQAKLDKIYAKKEKMQTIKQQKKQAKLDKINAKKAKKEAKKAEKEAKKTYQIVNSNSDLIAKPRTKKEIKENNKRLKKEAKKRRSKE